MSRLLRPCLVVLCIAAAGTARAQVQPPAEAPAQPPDPIHEVTALPRPASSTFLGDTGFWFVPTGEILPRGRFAVSGYVVSFDRTEQFARISHISGSIAFGIAGRLELFAGVRARTHIDAYALDRQLTSDERARIGRAFPMDYPFIAAASRAGTGDLFVGGKVNLASQSRQQPAAFAVRVVLKLPGAAELHPVAAPLPYAAASESLGTGKPDLIVETILSRELSHRVEFAGDFGVIIRGQPDDMTLSNGFRLGIGAAFPTRSAVRVSAELHGEMYWDPVITFKYPSLSVCHFQPEYCLAGSHPVQHPLDAFVGIDYRHRGGFFVGGGVGFAPLLKSPADFGVSTTAPFGGPHVQLRLGYHPELR